MKKTRILTLLSALLFLSGCNQKGHANKQQKNEKRYVVKIVKRGNVYRLGADGLTDEEFDEYTEGENVIPGDVIVIKTNDDLSTIEAAFEKQDLNQTYIAEVFQAKHPDWPVCSKYNYDLYFNALLENEVKEKIDIYKYRLKFDKYETCLINEDSSVSLIADNYPNTKFYCVFDASCITFNESSTNDQYIVEPLAFLSYLPISNTENNIFI